VAAQRMPFEENTTFAMQAVGALGHSQAEDIL